jgi:hypothetical protein
MHRGWFGPTEIGNLAAFFGINRQPAAEGGKVAATGDTERQGEIRNRLISLVDKAKDASLVTDSIYRVVAMEFEAISEARANRVSWNEIAKACGFSEKENRFRDAFSKERRRRAKKEKEVVPERKKEAMPDSKAKTQKESTFGPEEGTRRGPITRLSRGHFRIEPDRADDKL